MSTPLRRIVCLFAFGLIFCAAPVMAVNSDKEKAAITSAEKWLGLVDQGEYDKSWQEASVYFKQAVTQNQWRQAIEPLRKPFGKMVSRNVKSARYKTIMPGAPDGEYVVIEINTSFEKKKSAIETVIQMMDRDGIWRMSGYFIIKTSDLKRKGYRPLFLTK
jgi:hypothetical protein